MAGEFALGFRSAGNLLGPGRHRAIPDERVTAHGHLVEIGESQYLVGEVEIELPARRAQVIPEQAEFRRQLLAISFERDPIFGLIQERIEIDGRAVRDAPAHATR
jgi:hypothetical protein